MLTSIRILACSALAVVAAASLSAAAQEGKPQIERNILGHYDQAGVPGKEIVTGVVTLGAGAVIGFHVHPGDEAGYIIKGTIIWKVRGQPDKTLKAGDSFFNPRGSAHSVVGGDGGGTAFSTWIVDKGKPMAETIP